MDLAFDSTNNFVLGLIYGSIFSIIFVIIKHYYNKNKINKPKDKFTNFVKLVDKLRDINKDPKLLQFSEDGKPDYSLVMDAMATTLNDAFDGKDRVKDIRQTLDLTKLIFNKVLSNVCNKNN